MIKKKSLSVILIVFSLLIISCNKNDKFKIEKGKVGLISTVTTIKDLETIFNNDSLVKNLSEGALGNNYFQDDDEILVFEKGGKHLLTIIPKDQLDSTSTIRSIEIHDNRFKTEVGLSLSSNFSEINANNSIRPESTLQSVTLFLDELNATITIDKEELGIKDIITQKISLEQIPDLAKIKSFIVWFN
ncbi:hypothetical protein SAMN04487762_1833 [Polaribacter sp. Hel1_33_78]|jgi:hypothetical protein|uniref:hypothetical protein n=1 Tax=unclassified Polaribacter TaxID=196858 RepID=UPI00052DDD83|nr:MULTISPECIES: hypothetical protein [unclassified Polaribacter]KGL61166.1 hypothetical protein PHEL49_2064 [Polaribacter sp. Hel1_33_49]MBT3742225.1 hypothetical protein [Polaribacter sp.]MBT4413095.1 hypothetical protein [Polaribacter sp.]MBT7815273.1 hypothetical protein [Polaribacter sp.]MDG1195065.1 hypothetical protein [Polaribacter sp.]